MIKVLFVCIHNSARSQMAEELLRRAMDGQIDVRSAGLEPGTLNPMVVDVLLENGIDIRTKQTQSVFEVFQQGLTFNFVITVCDESSGQRCPIFPGRVNRLHWSFPDPSSFAGTYEEKL
ncbi:MAG: arsenate reductase ArsC, partial [Candidatus Cloacimonadaceae bacterium]|nr:arsenate reductase ArsC [Candidatus Cloacimonadaceae bacterium]